MAAHMVAQVHHLNGPVMEQPQYNMFHREKVEVEYGQVYKTVGLGTTVWSPLASGLLTGKKKKKPPRARAHKVSILIRAALDLNYSYQEYAGPVVRSGHHCVSPFVAHDHSLIRSGQAHSHLFKYGRRRSDHASSIFAAMFLSCATRPLAHLLAMLMVALTVSLTFAPSNGTQQQPLAEECENDPVPTEAKEFKVQEYLSSSQRSQFLAANSVLAVSSARATVYLDSVISVPLKEVAVPPPERA